MILSLLKTDAPAMYTILVASVFTDLSSFYICEFSVFGDRGTLDINVESMRREEGVELLFERTQQLSFLSFRRWSAKRYVKANFDFCPTVSSNNSLAKNSEACQRKYVRQGLIRLSSLLDLSVCQRREIDSYNWNNMELIRSSR